VLDLSRERKRYSNILKIAVASLRIIIKKEFFFLKRNHKNPIELFYLLDPSTSIKGDWLTFLMDSDTKFNPHPL